MPSFGYTYSYIYGGGYNDKCPKCFDSYQASAKHQRLDQDTADTSLSTLGAIETTLSRLTFMPKNGVKGKNLLFRYLYPSTGKNDFYGRVIEKRVKMPKSGSPMFIECNTFPVGSLKDHCCGLVIMIHYLNLSHWRLSICEGIYHNVLRNNGSVLSPALSGQGNG